MTTHTDTFGAAEIQALLVQKLRRSIEVPSKVLMCLHPYDQPIVLTRAWCLFELFQALDLGSSVNMCFAPEDENAFYEALQSGEFDAKAVCSDLDASKATATEADDKFMILHEIKERYGLHKYNGQLRKFLEEQYNLVALNVMHYPLRHVSTVRGQGELLPA